MIQKINFPYNIEVTVDEDFGIDPTGFNLTNFIPKGISTISGNTAIVDIKFIEDKNFFKPLKEILSKVSEISKENLESIVSKFGNYSIRKDLPTIFSIEFDIDNSFDLKEIYITDDSDIKRISISYRNCPVRDFYIIVKDSDVKVIISPFTKNYYTISDSEWLNFIRYIEEECSVSEIRDFKLAEIFGEKTNYNIIRQFKFAVNNKSVDRIVRNIWDFYLEKGYLSPKQLVLVIKKIDE